jgi:hypothetical protein
VGTALDTREWLFEQKRAKISNVTVPEPALFTQKKKESCFVSVPFPLSE